MCRLVIECVVHCVLACAGETVQFPVQFLAWRSGEYRAQLLFVDDAAGEFMHEIVAVATSPPPFDAVKWSQPSTIGRAPALMMRTHSLANSPAVHFCFLLLRVAVVAGSAAATKEVLIPYKNAALDKSRLQAVEWAKALSHRQK